MSHGILVAFCKQAAVCSKPKQLPFTMMGLQGQCHMRFSKGRSYNSHDTTVTVGNDGRWDVDQERGVRARCDLVLHAVVRFGPKGVTADITADHLNKRLKSNYTTSDVKYALKRLSDEGVIRAIRGGRGEDTVYRATKSSEASWRRIPKK